MKRINYTIQFSGYSTTTHILTLDGTEIEIWLDFHPTNDATHVFRCFEGTDYFYTLALSNEESAQLDAYSKATGLREKTICADQDFIEQEFSDTFWEQELDEILAELMDYLDVL